jgi:hypothetical protein
MYRLDSRSEAEALPVALDGIRPALEHRAAASAAMETSDDPARREAEAIAIRQRLMMAMGVAMSAYRELVASGALPHANTLGEQLKRLCRQQKTFGIHIEGDLQEMTEELKRAAAALRHEQFPREAIDKVAGELRDILPALLLLQNGRYQELLFRLIESLESANGDGRLDLKDQHLLQRLKQHESALSKIGRSETGDWEKVSVLIEDLADSSAPEDYRWDANRRRPN